MSKEISVDKKALLSGYTTDVVHCLNIPLKDLNILLPNAAVAEVIGYAEAEPIEGAPPWLLGSLSWRDRAVPLISCETAMGAQDVRDGNRIAILNTLNKNSRVPYIGIIMQDIPSLIRIKEEIIETRTDEQSLQSVAACVTVAGGEYVIPDLDDLEKRLENVSFN